MYLHQWFSVFDIPVCDSICATVALVHRQYLHCELRDFIFASVDNVHHEVHSFLPDAYGGGGFRKRAAAPKTLGILTPSLYKLRS
jgi:hypothetical protein